jgi:hypothetical protein
MTNLLVTSLVAGGKRQQSDIACLLDGTRQPPLMGGADAREAPGYYLSALSNKLLQQAYIAIVDGIDLLDTELANLLAAEELPSSPARATGARAGSASAGAARPRTSGPGSAWCAWRADFVSHNFPLPFE